jgi:hypothetical protein
MNTKHIKSLLMKTSHFNLDIIHLLPEVLGSRMIIRSLAAVFACLLTLAGCKNDERILETDRARKLLTASTWTIQSVTVDGTDRTSSHAGLTLHFTNTHYTTTHGGALWPESDIWTFVDNTGRVIVRGDDIEMTIQEINTGKLVLNFTWMETTLGPGRLSSTSGEHVLTFVK